MSILKLIIKREFIAKVRNKSFIVMTFLSPLLFVGLGVFIGYLGSMKSDVKEIVIHDEAQLFKNEFKNDEEFTFLDYSQVNIEALKDSIKTERYAGLLYIPKSENKQLLEKTIQYISNDSPSMSFISGIEDVIEKKITSENLVASGLDTIAIAKANSKVNINLTKASGEETLKGLNEIKIGIGVAFGYLIMMFIIIYGNMVMRSVIEEKTNRIIEIIISSVKPFQLMMGKIIGTSLAGILQFVIWAILGAILLFVGTTLLGLDMGATPAVSPQLLETAQSDNLLKMQLYIAEFKNMPIGTLLVSFVIYFIGGYFLYSSIYAAIGAAVDNETDSQQFLFPIIVPLMLGVYVGFFAVMKDPHGSVATIFSMIPLTSPIVMLMRIPFGVPLWQIAISILMLFATFFLVVWFAAKIYRVGILMYGKKTTWKELYKWLRY